MAQHGQFADLVADLIRHEALRLTVYDDATGLPIEKGTTVVGRPTIGVGRLLDKGRGLTKAEVIYLLDNDIPLTYTECLANIECFSRLDPVRRDMVMNLHFNMGWPAFSKFKKFFAALDLQNWAVARAELLNSKWARDVGEKRSTYIAHGIEHGQRRP